MFSTREADGIKSCHLNFCVISPTFNPTTVFRSIQVGLRTAAALSTMMDALLLLPENFSASIQVRSTMVGGLAGTPRF